jgi:hypothetical protein
MWQLALWGAELTGGWYFGQEDCLESQVNSEFGSFLQTKIWNSLHFGNSSAKCEKFVSKCLELEGVLDPQTTDIQFGLSDNEERNS